MWLLAFLAGCYERVVTDARIDVRREMVHVVVQRQSVDAQEGHGGCTDAPDCVTKLREVLDREAKELAAAGATDIVGGVALRGDELDIVQAYEAPLGSSLFDGDAILRRVTETRPSGKIRVLPAVLVADELPTPGSGVGSRTTVTVDGPWRRFDLSGDPAAALWVLPRGRPEVHAVVERLNEDGTLAEIDPWVSGVPGLADALRASGLVVDVEAVLRPR